MRRFALAAALVALLVPLAHASNLAQTDKPAPPVKLKKLGDGSALGLDALKDRAGILEFWATWCPPCRKSIPHLIEIRSKYPEDKLAIVGITDESADKVQPFVEQMKMNYTIALDEGGKAGQDYGCDSIPRAFVLDSAGTILWEGNPLDAENFEAAIEKAVATAKGQAARDEEFAAKYAALVDKGEGADAIAFDVVENGGKKPVKRTFKLGADRKASVEVRSEGAAAKKGEVELTEKEVADLIAALKAAEFAKAPAKIGAGKPGAVVVQLVVGIGADARKSIEFVTENALYADKGAKNPDKLVALWKKLEAAIKKAEGKAK